MSDATNSNHLNTPGRHGRREFIRRATLLAGAGVAAPWALDLAGVTSASAEAAGNDYRALVCLFMHGGNDHNDTMVPYDQKSFDAYAAVRGSLTRQRNTLLPLYPTGGSPDGRSLAFTPQWAGLKSLFDRGDLAVVGNVGTLVEHIDKAGYDNAARRPPQLFSHNDQSSLWQSSAPEGATTGWGGRLGDLLLDDNGQNSTFTCISASGNAVMLSGREATQFHVSSRGVVKLEVPFWSSAPLEGLEALMLRNGGADPFTQSYAELSQRALNTSEFLSTAIASAGGVSAAFPETGIGGQLRTVADVIAAGRNQLGVKRQVFFVSMGGFDNHSDLDERHSALLSELDSALVAFHSATEELGIVDEVTTFTASDFGRTLTGNGDGSDHGWGSHHVVMGGSVRGKRIYGRLPMVGVDGPDDVGQGRMIPTTAVDQYSATLASWMGATGGELSAVVPNIGRFDSADLGFMRTGSGVAGGGLAGRSINGPGSVLEPARRMTT